VLDGVKRARLTEDHPRPAIPRVPRHRGDGPRGHQENEERVGSFACTTAFHRPGPDTRGSATEQFDLLWGQLCSEQRLREVSSRLP